MNDDAVTPLRPEELDRVEQMDAQTRAAWMLEEVARHEMAWALTDDNGWVLFKLDNSPAGQSPYALPLWPRQELAALSARDSSEQPRAVDLETVLEELLPQVAQEGWRVLACPAKNVGLVEEAAAFSTALADAWTQMLEEDA